MVLDLYLRDVASSSDVLGKRYQVSPEEIPAVAHAFANEILGLLTGKPGGFGGQVVFSSDASGSEREIYSMVLGSTERRQLTNDGAKASSPSWSPDGRSVTYSLSSKMGQSDVHIVPSIGGKSTKITFLSGEETRPSFGGDGKQLLVTARVSGKQSITLFNLRGRLLEKLSESSADNFDATWSPDYQDIVFVSNRSGQSLLYVMKVDGSRVREIGKLAGKTCFRPAWSPVESRVVVSCSSPESSSQLYLVDLGTGEFNQVTFQGDNLEPAWSPDGRMIVFSSRENKSSQADLAVFSLGNLKVTMVAKTPQDDREPSWSYKAIELSDSQ